MTINYPTLRMTGKLGAGPIAGPNGVRMLRIRLRRVGKKGRPSYRIVVADSAAPRDGAYVEWIGQYDPMVDPPAVVLKQDRALEWLSKGAQPSDAVRRLLDKNGIYDQLNSPSDEPTEELVTAEEQTE